jgi:hypothetical protein
MRSSRSVAVLTFLAGLALVACSGSPAGSGAPSVASAAASPSASEPAASASESASAEPSVEPSAGASGGTSGELAVTALDFSFQLPATVPGGPTVIRLTNGGKEEHQAQLARLNEGKQLSDLLTALQANDFKTALEAMTLSGGPAPLPAGGTGATGVALEPGDYVFLCFVASPDGVPHFAKGMVAPLEVTAPPVAGALPGGDASLTLKDFTFDGLTTLTTGPHTVSVTNAGPQPHEAGIVRLGEGVTVADLKEAMTASAPPTGPAPITSAGGISAIAPNAEATLEIDLPAGNYAFLCFVPDPASGKAHAQLGMIAPLTVQ